MNDIPSVEPSRLGHAVADHKGIISAVDPVFCDQLGMASWEVIGRHILDITHPDDRLRNRGAIDRLIRERRPYRLDKRYIRGDGSTIEVSVHASFLDDGGTTPRMIAATERRDGIGKVSRRSGGASRDQSVFDALDRMAKLPTIQ